MGEIVIEIIGVVSGVLAVVGVILNNRKYRWCFLLWMASNILSCVIHLSLGPWSLVVRDMVFLCLAVEGWFLWR